MTTALRSLLVLFMFVGGFTREATSVVDALEAEFAQMHEPQLRWDNIEQAPNWVAGVKPSYSLWGGLHTLSLEPGQSVTVRLPAHEMLRLQEIQGDLRSDALSISLSNGSGLFLETPIIPGADQENLLVTSDAAYPQLAKITRTDTMIEYLEFAVFVSRNIPTGTDFPYRDVVDLTGPNRPRVVIENREHGEAEDYWPMPACTPIDVQAQSGYTIRIGNSFRLPTNGISPPSITLR